MPRLDYSNATLAGLPAFQIRRLQSVLNAAARLIHRSPRHEQITLILRDLHWLRSPERIDFKLTVLVYRCLHGLAPHYLSDYCCLFQPSTTSFIVIIAATDSTNTTHNCRRPSFSSRRMPPLERSSTRRYVSSDSRCFPKAAQNLSFLSFVDVVTDASRTDTPLSGLAVFDYRPL